MNLIVATFGVVLAVSCLMVPSNGLPLDVKDQASENQQLRGYGENPTDDERERRIWDFVKNTGTTGHRGTTTTTIVHNDNAPKGLYKGLTGRARREYPMADERERRFWDPIKEFIKKGATEAGETVGSTVRNVAEGLHKGLSGRARRGYPMADERERRFWDPIKEFIKKGTTEAGETVGSTVRNVAKVFHKGLSGRARRGYPMADERERRFFHDQASENQQLRGYGENSMDDERERRFWDFDKIKKGDVASEVVSGVGSAGDIVPDAFKPWDIHCPEFALALC